MVSVEQVLPGVYHVAFDDQRTMARSFGRIQEFFESPNPLFRANWFSLGDMLDWVEKTYGWNYLDEIDGFNVPGWVVKAVRHGVLGELSAEEERLVGLVAAMPEPFYVIGSLAGDQATLNHEIGHALHYLRPSYRQRVGELLDAAGYHAVDGPFAPLTRYLREHECYAEDVMKDEVHAWLMFEQRYLTEEKGLDLAPYKDVTARLLVNFDSAVAEAKRLAKIS